MDNKEITDIIKEAQDYIRALKRLENEVKIAEQQIENSAEETENNILVSFSNLLESLTKTLENRRNRLVQKTKTVKDKSLKPLRDCRKIISNKIEVTEKFVSLGEKIAKEKNRFDFNEFNANSSFLGSLPEVPALNEVPCISYQSEVNVSKGLIQTCSSFGSVSSIAPIQICSLLEKPGSILVEWHCIENDDTLTDIQEFRLQRAHGNVFFNKEMLVDFTDCYIGPDSQYLVKDLQINQNYSFRVCCKFEGVSSWSLWSLPQIAETSIKPYCWENNQDCNLRNENKVVKPLQLNTVVYSNGPLFHVGYSIEFTFLECDKNLNGTYVGITYTNNRKSIDDLISDSFTVETNGDVYINGVKKGTKLPEVHVTSKICFTCNQIGETKILVNVDCNDKRVTYDWTLSNDDVLYFFAAFNSTKWKLMVE